MKRSSAKYGAKVECTRFCNPRRQKFGVGIICSISLGMIMVCWWNDGSSDWYYPRELKLVEEAEG